MLEFATAICHCDLPLGCEATFWINGAGTSNGAGTTTAINDRGVVIPAFGWLLWQGTGSDGLRERRVLGGAVQLAAGLEEVMFSEADFSGRMGFAFFRLFPAKFWKFHGQPCEKWRKTIFC